MLNTISYKLIIVSLLNTAFLFYQPLAKANCIKLTTQSDLLDREYAEKIENFWQTKEKVLTSSFLSDGKIVESIRGTDGKIIGYKEEMKDISNAKINIHYAKIIQEDREKEKGAIVISTGRTETYLKYKEVAYDLWNNGYSIYIIDHRGQGKSDRELGIGDEKQKGHVEDFGLFVSDFKQLVDEVVKEGGHRNLYLIAHSMGGAIASIYLQQEGDKTPFKAAVFTSPMHMITGVFQRSADIASCRGARRMAQDNPYGYIVGGGPYKYRLENSYQPKFFEDNEYTNDKERYRRLFEEYRKNQDVQLGDPTHGWLADACDAARDARENASKITIPVRLYQAEKDTIVHRRGHATFCENLKPKYSPERCGGSDGGPIRIPGAKHELLIAQDGARNRVLKESLAFFEKYRQ